MIERGHRVEIKLNGDRSEVFLDGERVQGVRSVSLAAGVGEAPLVTLQLIPGDLGVTGIGDVLKVGGSPAGAVRENEGFSRMAASLPLGDSADRGLGGHFQAGSTRTGEGGPE